MASRPWEPTKTIKNKEATMKKLFTFTRVGVALGCAALILFGTAAGRPHRTVPVEGSCGTTFKLIPTGTPGVFNVRIEGVGNVSRLGFCTIFIDAIGDFRNNPPT